MAFTYAITFTVADEPVGPAPTPLLSIARSDQNEITVSWESADTFSLYAAPAANGPWLKVATEGDAKSAVFPAATGPEAQDAPDLSHGAFFQLQVD